MLVSSKTGVIDAINRSVVNVTSSTLTVTSAYKGKVMVANRAAGVVFTLPAATAATVGDSYTFLIGTTITSNNFSVVSVGSSDLFYGSVEMYDTDTAMALAHYAPNFSSNYQLTSNGSTTGGVAGQWVTFTCLGLDAWFVEGVCYGTGSVATPFAG